MNWKWIGILACVSLLTALLTVFGVMPEGPMGIVIGIVEGLALSYVFARNTDERFFRNGFTLGAVSGLVASLVQMMFFNTMVENNPQMSERMSKMPSSVNPVVFMAISAPITIAVSGALQGLFTLGMAALLGKRSGRRAVPPPSSPPSPV